MVDANQNSAEAFMFCRAFGVIPAKAGIQKRHSKAGSRIKSGMTRMGTGLVLSLASFSPALAEGFNLTQLIMADFKLKAATYVPGRAGGAGTEVIYLQGKLPGGTYEVIMRCTARPDPEEGSSNCEQVY